MSKWKNEAEAREQIKDLVADYYNQFKKPEQEKTFNPGDRISYASRVYDEKEMQSLTDAMLDFWLTTGRFSDEFEKKFAEWIGVKYAHLVNSGSSANLIAFMTLTAPELGDRQIKRGDEVIVIFAVWRSVQGRSAPRQHFNLARTFFCIVDKVVDVNSLNVRVLVGVVFDFVSRVV